MRWLRADYQASRFADPRSVAAPEVQILPTPSTAVDAGRTAFPADPDEQSEAVLRMLEERHVAMSAADLAAGFRSRRKGLLDEINAALLVLAQYGHISMTPGGRFVARRVA